jgi:hypothetical protein
MRTFALLFLLSACASAQPKLSAQDESDIRTAIEEQAKKDNQRPSHQIWNERGPFVYSVRRIEPLVADVATAEADGAQTGSLYGRLRRYTFILTRTHGRWSVAKKIPMCWPGPTLQPISGSPQCAEPGSSDCPN